MWLDYMPLWFVTFMCWLDSNVIFPIRIFNYRHPRVVIAIRTIVNVVALAVAILGMIHIYNYTKVMAKPKDEL